MKHKKKVDDMKHKGAWIEACEEVINKDFKLKSELIQKVIDGELEWPEGVTVGEFIFGDYMAFADKLNKALNE